MVWQLSVAKGGWVGWIEYEIVRGVDQYNSQFLMRAGIGPRQAEQIPALAFFRLFCSACHHGAAAMWRGLEQQHPYR